jgi:hypothetical protein
MVEGKRQEDMMRYRKLGRVMRGWGFGYLQASGRVLKA